MSVATLHSDYYTARESQCDYDGYWGVTVDPDGNRRDRSTEEERCKFLGDITEEMAFIDGLEPGCVLDVGAGPGWFLQALTNQWEEYAVEIAPEALAALSLAGIPAVEAMDELPSGFFDLVFFHHVIEHLRDPVEMVEQIHRVMAPAAWLILGTPDFDSPCAQRFGANYRMLHDETHCSLFSQLGVDRLLRDSGFDVREVRYPFPSRFATVETFARWGDPSKVSPPWPGNHLTFYAQRATS